MPRCRLGRMCCERARSTRRTTRRRRDRRLDGQPMTVTLPLRIVVDDAGWIRARAHRPADDPPPRQARSGSTSGDRSQAAPRPVGGGRAQVAGRLTNRDGQGIAGQEVRVYSTSPLSPEQLVAVLQTDAEGRYRYTAVGSMNRILRFAFAGSALVLPAQTAITMRVPGRTSLGVTRQPGAQRRGRDVPWPAAHVCRRRRAASSWSCRYACPAAGRPSARSAPTRRDAGRSSIGSGERAASSATASAPGCRTRRTTHSRPAAPVRSRSE